MTDSYYPKHANDEYSPEAKHLPQALQNIEALRLELKAANAREMAYRSLLADIAGFLEPLASGTPQASKFVTRIHLKLDEP